MMNNLGYNEIGDEAIIFLHQFPALQELYLHDARITGKGIEILSEGDFPHLRQLWLGNKIVIIGGN